MQHFQDGGHDVISCRNVLPHGQSTQAATQQHQQFLIYSTFVRFAEVTPV